MSKWMGEDRAWACPGAHLSIHPQRPSSTLCWQSMVLSSCGTLSRPMPWPHSHSRRGTYDIYRSSLFLKKILFGCTRSELWFMGLFSLVVAWRIFSCSMQGQAWGGLIPWPGIEPGPPVLGALSLSHWTTREVPAVVFIKGKKQLEPAPNFVILCLTCYSVEYYPVVKKETDANFLQQLRCFLLS